MVVCHRCLDEERPDRFCVPIRIKTGKGEGGTETPLPIVDPPPSLGSFASGFGFDWPPLDTLSARLTVSHILRLPRRLVGSVVSFDFAFQAPDAPNPPSPTKKRHAFPPGSTASMVQKVNVTLDDVSPLIEYSPREAWVAGTTTDPFWQE